MESYCDITLKVIVILQKVFLTNFRILLILSNVCIYLYIYFIYFIYIDTTFYG